MSESAHAQAEAAIEAMGGLDAALAGSGTDGPATPPPNPNPQPQTQEAKPGISPEQPPPWQGQTRDETGRWTQPPQEQTPQTPQAPQAQPESFMGESFDPSSLEPHLLQRYHEMQTAFTRKTQEIADQRRLYESLGDPQTLQQAAILRDALQDPNQMIQLHSELSDHLQSIGYTPQQADAGARSAIVDAQEARVPNAAPDLSTLEDLDPNLKQYVEGLTSEVSELRGFKDEFAQWREHQESQQLEMALIGEVNRQVSAIRESRPDYTEADINAIYELGPYYDGDLFAATKRYDEIFNERMTRYLAGKQQTAVAPTTAVVPGADAQTRQPLETTWANARAQALQYAAQLDGSA